MKTFRYLLGLISTVALAAIGWYAYMVFLSDPLANKDDYMPYINQGLKSLGVSEPGWDIMVLATTHEVDGARDKVWEVWSQLEKWPEWASPLVGSATWRGDPEWKTGSQFALTLNLGWPVETIKTTEKIEQVMIPDRAVYVRTGGLSRSWHVWRFEFMAGGRTKVTSVEVLVGSEIGYLRPYVEKRWQRRHEIVLEGLASRLERPR
jgi:hypothetical protein